jgi:hypothetical protein
VRIESSVTSVSWLPSGAVEGVRGLPFAVGAARYDDPPPDVLGDVTEWVSTGAVRQANELRAWIEVENDRVLSAGYSGEGIVGAVDVELGGRSLHAADVELPLIQKEPEISERSARFTQSAGGRINVPLPRRVAGVPFMRITAPIAWTTLALTIHGDGTSEGALVGSSPFPRHWVYDGEGQVTWKSAAIDFERWLRESRDEQTPWGREDSHELAVAVESALERVLSRRIMGERRRVLKIAEGDMLTEQGARDQAVFLVLDGILDVDVGGQTVAEVGPGSIVGERASIEGRRTATLRARTRCRVVPFDPSELEPADVEQLAAGHRAEND